MGWICQSNILLTALITPTSKLPILFLLWIIRQIVNPFRGANGCNGAAPHAYPVWFANDGGSSPHEAKYPYLGGSPKLNCNTAANIPKWNSGAKVTNAVYDFSCSQDKLKQLVSQKGAVLVGVYASDRSFSDYDGRGVYDKCSQ